MDEEEIKNAIREVILEMSDDGKIIDYAKIGEVLSETVNEELIDFESELGDKWLGGKIIIEPGSEELQPKEIPIDVFFKKIVSIRDKLRVLEQQINSNETIDETEKIKLQSYITRCYGTLTTFNILFKRKPSHFKGMGVQ